MFDLRLQDPGASGGYLLEALLEAAATADRGGAAFAWANRTGARLLLADPAFVRLTSTGQFDLVVGTDSITDEAAVGDLSALEASQPGLTVRAFVHDKATVLFHPKFAWFGSGKSVRLVVGSGNLTMGGTRGNWEAFAVVDLTGSDASRTEAEIARWLASWQHYLLPLNEKRVIDQVRTNTGRERDLKLTGRRTGGLTPGPNDGLPVLVAEIPKSGDRWKQANFDRENYENFFGAKVGSQRRISLVHVAGDGTLGPHESRPSVEVESQNYRFELAAAGGLEYPASGSPIGVFVKTDDGTFMYQLLMPGDPDHATVSGFLDSNWSGNARQKRRVRTSVASLKANWSTAALWRASVSD